MEKEEPLFKNNPEGENTIGEKKKLRILIIIIALLVIAIVVLIIFLVKDDDDDDDDSSPVQDEHPFKQIDKENREINLVPKSGKYDYILIFLHGLLGSSSDFLDKFNKKDGPIPDNFKIILPCASEQFVTRLNFSTTSWFDLYGINNDVIVEKDIDYEGLNESADLIKKIIKDEVKNVGNNYTRIFVGGFSQGACLSYQIGLSFEHTLGGIIPFCAIPHSQTPIVEENNKNLNIFSILGGRDIYFPLDYALNQTFTVLSNLTNLKIEIFKDQEHAVEDIELDYVKAFIKSLL